MEEQVQAVISQWICGVGAGSEKVQSIRGHLLVKGSRKEARQFERSDREATLLLVGRLVLEAFVCQPPGCCCVLLISIYIYILCVWVCVCDLSASVKALQDGHTFRIPNRFSNASHKDSNTHWL